MATLRPVSPIQKAMRDSGSSPIFLANKNLPTGSISPFSSPRISPSHSDRIRTPRAFRPSPVYSDTRLSVTPSPCSMWSPRLTSPKYLVADESSFCTQIVRKGSSGNPASGDVTQGNSSTATSPRMYQVQEHLPVSYCGNRRDDDLQNQENDSRSFIVQDMNISQGNNNFVPLEISEDGRNANSSVESTSLFANEFKENQDNNNVQTAALSECNYNVLMTKQNESEKFKHNGLMKPFIPVNVPGPTNTPLTAPLNDGDCSPPAYTSGIKINLPPGTKDEDSNMSAFRLISKRRRSSLPVIHSNIDPQIDIPRRGGTPNSFTLTVPTYSVLSEVCKNPVDSKDQVMDKKEAFRKASFTSLCSIRSDKIDYFVIPSPSSSGSTGISPEIAASCGPESHEKKSNYHKSEADETPVPDVGTKIQVKSVFQHEGEETRGSEPSRNRNYLANYDGYGREEDDEYCVMDHWDSKNTKCVISDTTKTLDASESLISSEKSHVKQRDAGETGHRDMDFLKVSSSSNKDDILHNTVTNSKSNLTLVHRQSIPVDIGSYSYIESLKAKKTNKYNIRSLSLSACKEQENLSPADDRGTRLSPVHELKPILSDSGECLSPRSAVFPIQCSPSVTSPKSSLTQPYSPRVLSPSSISRSSTPSSDCTVDEKNKNHFDKLLNFEELVESFQKKNKARHLSAIESEEEYSDHSVKSSKSMTSQQADEVTDSEKMLTPHESPMLPKKRPFAFDAMSGSLSNSSSMSNLQDIPEIPAICIDDCDELQFADQSSCSSDLNVDINTLKVPSPTSSHSSFSGNSSTNSPGSQSPVTSLINFQLALNCPDGYMPQDSDQDFESDEDYQNSRRTSRSGSIISTEVPFNSSRRSSFIQEGFSRVTTPCFDDRSLIRSVSASPFGTQLKYFQERFKNNMFILKTATKRLGLQTRRKSYMEWRNKNLDEKGRPRLKKREEIEVAGLERNDVPRQNVYDPEDRVTAERLDQIAVSLDWLREELSNMRDNDNSLAMQFLQIRKTMHEFKLAWSCEQHREMLEDAHIEVSETKTLKSVCDLPEFHADAGRFMYKHFTPKSIAKRKFSMI